MNAEKKIARVFPRKTRATPIDKLCFFDVPGLFAPEVDEVHVSVAFTWDKPKAEWLAYQWEKVAPVKIGGPAYDTEGGEFVPGMYLKNGYVITSRGCPNKCWFCKVWKREKEFIELEIKDGWILQDDNFLACSRDHIESVFEMLKRNSKNHKVELRGIEPKLLEVWHVELMMDLKPHQIWLAYDEEKEYAEVERAITILKWAGFTRQQIRCYCLIGYPGDRTDRALHRLYQILDLGAFPFAMFYRDDDTQLKYQLDCWKKIQREFSRPAIINSIFKERQRKRIQ